MRARSLVNAASFGIALLVSASWAAPLKPGVERWAIKTSVPATANTTHPKVVAFSDIIQLAEPPGVTKNDHRFQSALIPAFTNSLNVQEGQIVQTTGWLHLIAFEADGDYHVQISASRDSGDQCLIAETPDPDPAFVKDTTLHPQLTAVREFMKSKLLAGKDPSSSGNVLTHPVCVTVSGQLFYDDAHVGTPPRGKKGMHAATLWEFHPVTAIAFSTKCAQ